MEERKSSFELVFPSIGVTCHEIGANTTVAPQQEDDEGGKRGKQAGMDGICFQG